MHPKRKRRTIPKCPTWDRLKNRRNRKMTFHMNLKGKNAKSEMDSFEKLEELQKEAESALLMIEHTESENNNSSITALGRIYAFHREAHSDDKSFERYRTMCKSKGIKTKGRDSNDVNTTLCAFLGNGRNLKTRKSRWKGALLHANRIGVDPEGFENAISKEEEGIVAWSSKWYRSVRPDQTKLAVERDDNYLEQHAKAASNPKNLRFCDLIEGKEGVIIQKRHGKIVIFEARHLSPSEIRRVLRKHIHPKGSIQ